jgi:hypothetical protein
VKLRANDSSIERYSEVRVDEVTGGMCEGSQDGILNAKIIGVICCLSLLIVEVPRENGRSSV